MSYILDPISDNCYPNTTILVNKFDIRDERELADVEALITFTKTSQLEEHPLDGCFDFEHYKSIHGFLFEDLYDWAGHIRTVNISKKGTRFCPCEEITFQARLVFDRLEEKRLFKGLRRKEYIDELVDFYINTNYLHPFREGNGRTQRAFIAQLVRFAGHDIDLSGIDTDLLMMATVQSANGVNNLLRDILDYAVRF